MRRFIPVLLLALSVLIVESGTASAATARRMTYKNTATSKFKNLQYTPKWRRPSPGGPVSLNPQPLPPKELFRYR